MRAIINFFKRIFGFGRTTKVPVEAPTGIPEPIKNPPSDVGSGFPDISVGEVRNATDNEMKMIGKAIVFNRMVVYSPEFKEAVLAAEFTETNGLTNLQIWEKFTTGSIKVNIEMFTGSFTQNRIYKTVGYDLPGDDFTYINRYFVQDEITMGSLILHELSHALGFSHYNKYTQTSVPYTMNHIFELVARKLGLAA